MKHALFGMGLAIGLALAGASDAQAQGLHLGLQGGYNYAQLSEVPTDVDEVGDKGSFVVGAFLDIQFHEMLFVGVEGNYIESKSELDGDVFKQGHIQIPAYLGVRLMSGLLQPNLYAGAAASFEASCKLEDASCDELAEPISTKSAIWSAIFGGGLDVALGFIRLNGDVRYNLGLSKVADDEDAKWNNWMFLVGAGIGLGN